MASEETSGHAVAKPAARLRDGYETRPVGIEDIGAIVASGIADFRKAPLISVAIASIYTVGGWLLALLLIRLEMPFLVYPLAMGFALIAPFVAVAFYDVSRRLEQGATPALGEVIASVAQARKRDLRWMALITAFAFFIWMDLAAMLTLSFFGAAALDFKELTRLIVSTPEGWAFLVVGHVMGAIIAFIVFSISAVSFPLLFDRDVDVMTAMITSARLVMRNPLSMGLWCATIALSIGLALASWLVLLPAILPVLGYASWHLYRRAVASD